MAGPKPHKRDLKALLAARGGSSPEKEDIVPTISQAPEVKLPKHLKRKGRGT